MATTAGSLASALSSSFQCVELATTNSHDGTTLGGFSSQSPAPASAGQSGDTRGFGILQHTGPPVQDDIPGLYRDGRVRNPVPSKLKGKTDVRKGNFGVMHIDLTTTNETQERDAAAKRTSEGTQLAAKMAQTDRYVPIKRSKYIHRPAEQATSGSTQPSTPRHRTSPLTAAETKIEQARLLTLLRSLHPALVVDQLCKALAFFGGICGAELPTDRPFPDSAESNGPGSLFVGWLAEIFPALGQVPGLSGRPTLEKRPRGRPRGSKNAKVRKEKSFKNRLALVACSVQAPESCRVADGTVQDSTIDDSWVDVDETNHIDDDEEVTEVSRDTTGQDITTTLGNKRPIPGASAPDGEARRSVSHPSVATPTPKRRGRPKGSKNRPKNVTSLPDTAQKPVDAADSATATGTAEDGTPVPKKRNPGPGRPKGSKNRPKGSRAFTQAIENESQEVPAGPKSEQQGASTSSGAMESGSMHVQGVTVIPAKPVHLQQSLHRNPLLPTPTHASQQELTSTAAKSIPTVASKGTKRKRTGPVTKMAGEDVSHVPPENVVDLSSGDQPASQATAKTGYTMASNGTTKQPAKRRKAPKDTPQQSASGSQTDQHASDNQAPPILAVSKPSQQPPTMVEDYSADLISTDNTGVIQSTGNRMARSVNRSPQQSNVNSQHAVSGPQSDFGQNSEGSQPQPSKPTTTASYPMNFAGGSSQGKYNQARSPEGLYGQQAQRQQQQQPQQTPQQHQQQMQNSHRHQPQVHQRQQQSQQLQQGPSQQGHSQNHDHGNHHHMRNSSGGRIASAAGHDANAFDGSSSQGAYRDLLSHQSSFSTQVTMSASSNSNYRNSATRSVGNQPPAFQRSAKHTASSSMSYQDYSDPAFLDMAGLNSASQGGLPSLNQPSYGMADDSMQRPSSAMSPSYDSASSLGHSFNGSMTAERMYHTMRRQ